MWWLSYIFLPLLASFAGGLLLGLLYRWQQGSRLIELESAAELGDEPPALKAGDAPPALEVGGEAPVTENSPAEQEVPVEKRDDEEFARLQREAERSQSLEQQLRSLRQALKDRDLQIELLQRGSQ